MPLVNMNDMLQHAYSHGYAVASFHLVDLKFVQGVVAAAERCRAPVILSLAERHSAYYDFELFMSAVELAAGRAEVPVAIQFDHGTSEDSTREAINRGCNGIMIDASDRTLDENIRLTQQVVEMAHACDVSVESELGYVPGVEGEDADSHAQAISYTTAAEAKAYVRMTGVDSLAISIGTVHGRTRKQPRLDWPRLKQINEAVNIPLVIHGGSGLTDDQVRRLVANGVAKINYFTALADAAADIIVNRDNAMSGTAYTGLMQRLQHAISEPVEKFLRCVGSAGRAAEVLTQCAPWTPIEQEILLTGGAAETATSAARFNELRDYLRGLPGVREVAVGRACSEDSKYRYSLRMRFCSPRALAHFRNQPENTVEMNRSLRNLAAHRLCLEFETFSAPRGTGQPPFSERLATMVEGGELNPDCLTDKDREALERKS